MSSDEKPVKRAAMMFTFVDHVTDCVFQLADEHGEPVMEVRLDVESTTYTRDRLTRMIEHMRGLTPHPTIH